MSGLPPIARRGFLGATLGGGLLAGLPLRAAGATHVLIVHDPAIPASRAFAVAAAARGATLAATEGEAVRIARDIGLRLRPDRIAGLTGYADFLLFADALRETGYRIAGHGFHGGDHRCHGALADCARLLETSGAAWPEALAEVVIGVGRAMRRPVPRRTGILVSWIAVPRAI